MDYQEPISCEIALVHPQAVEAARQNMPAEPAIAGLAETFKIFGDPTRMRIICALLIGELCVCDLQQLLGATQSAVSHQLRLLRAHRLVKFRRDGKQVYYSLDDEHVSRMVQLGLEHIGHATQKEDEHHA